MERPDIFQKHISQIINCWQLIVWYSCADDKTIHKGFQCKCVTTNLNVFDTLSFYFQDLFRSFLMCNYANMQLIWSSPRIRLWCNNRQDNHNDKSIWLHMLRMINFINLCWLNSKCMLIRIYLKPLISMILTSHH